MHNYQRMFGTIDPIAGSNYENIEVESWYTSFNDSRDAMAFGVAGFARLCFEHRSIGNSLNPASYPE